MPQRMGVCGDMSERAVSSFNRLFIENYIIIWSSWHLPHVCLICLTLSRRRNLYPETTAHTLIDCYLSLTMTGPEHTYACTTTPLWYGISSKGIACWQVANKAIIFWRDRMNYCNHSVHVSGWICAFLFPVVCSDKDMTRFISSRAATRLYHYWIVNAACTVYIYSVSRCCRRAISSQTVQYF